MLNWKVALAGACSALALGAAAQAQTIDVSGFASSNTSQNGVPGADVPGAGIAAGTGGTSSFNSFYTIDSKAITFESGSTVIGNSIVTSSTSRIDMTINNRGDGFLAPTLLSQITAAGMGVYIGDNTNNACFSSPAGCAQSRSNLTFQDFAKANNGFPLAATDVEFQIVQGDARLYDVKGSLEFSVDGPVFIFNDTADAEGDPNANPLTSLNGFVTLNKFGLLNANGTSDSALGFAWDATDIAVDTDTISAFSSSTISYIVTVDSITNANCITDSAGNPACLVAYSGFGDPIGRGGDISSAAFGPFRGLNFGGPPPGTQFINGVNFSPFQVSVPTFDANGNIVLTSQGLGGVPEPATWLSMILGFGLLGAALRCRRTAAFA